MQAWAKKLAQVFSALALSYLGLALLAAFAFDGYVMETKIEEGQYRLLLRLGRQPAEWVDTTFARYWFEVTMKLLFQGIWLTGFSCWVVCYLWREWRKAQETKDAAD